MARSTSVTRESQYDDAPATALLSEPDLGQGYRHDRHVLTGHHQRGTAQHVLVGEDVRAADLERPSHRLRMVEHPDQVAHGVVQADGLGPGAGPVGGDHQRQPARQLPGHLPRDPAVAHHDGGTEHGHRDPVRAEQPLHLPAGAEVRGQRLVVDAQPAEVDDLPTPESAAAMLNALAARASLSSKSSEHSECTR